MGVTSRPCTTECNTTPGITVGVTQFGCYTHCNTGSGCYIRCNTGSGCYIRCNTGCGCYTHCHNVLECYTYCDTQTVVLRVTPGVTPSVTPCLHVTRSNRIIAIYMDGNWGLLVTASSLRPESVAAAGRIGFKSLNPLSVCLVNAAHVMRITSRD